MPAAEKPQSRAARRSKKRVEGEPISVPFRGESYTVAHVDDWPFRTLRMLNDGNIDEVLEIIMDEENAEKFLAQPGLTVGHVNEFFEVVKQESKAGN